MNDTHNAPATATRFLLVGRGKVGTGLSVGLAKSNAEVRLTSVGGLDEEALRWADGLVLCVPDHAIRTVASALPSCVNARQLPVLHCAGARPAGEIDSALEYGAVHPLVSFAASDTPPDLTGKAFLIDARSTSRAIDFAKRLVDGVSAKAVIAPAQGAAYHAAAALAANGTAALHVAALSILEALGITTADAAMMLAGLLETVADNVRRHPGPGALTGPIVRGDVETVRAHRSALRTVGVGLEAYDRVANVVVECAIAAGLDERSADEVRDALRESADRSGISAPPSSE